MIVPSHLQNQTILVLGLGRTGLSLCYALREAGARVYAWDDGEGRRAAAAREGFDIFPDTLSSWQALASVVVSPGIPWRWPAPHDFVRQARHRGVACHSDIDIFAQTFFHQQEKPRVVGITGTNGKSTTTALMAHVLSGLGVRSCMGGNIGVPVLSLDSHGVDAYVLELSSYQLEMSRSLFLQDAVMLNISPDHLTRHGGMGGYVAAKRIIFEGIPQGGRGFIGVDDAYCAQLYGELHAQYGDKITPLSTEKALDRGIYVVDGQLVDACEGAPIVIGPIDHMPTLVGRHNWQNMLAVYAVVRNEAKDKAGVLDLFRRFPGLSHRQERVGCRGSITFINDSKATNVNAAEKALSSYENIYWIAGGLAKEGGLQGLEPYFHKIKHAFLIGQSADDFAGILGAHHVPFTVSHTLAQAVEDAAKAAFSAGQEAVVLLSPACASFGQFKDFEERGDRFRAHVHHVMTDHDGTNTQGVTT